MSIECKGNREGSETVEFWNIQGMPIRWSDLNLTNQIRDVVKSLLYINLACIDCFRLFSANFVDIHEALPEFIYLLHAADSLDVTPEKNPADFDDVIHAFFGLLANLFKNIIKR